VYAFILHKKTVAKLVIWERVRVIVGLFGSLYAEHIL